MRKNEFESIAKPEKPGVDDNTIRIGVNEMFGRWTLLALLTCIAAHAQDTQFLPEVDSYLKLNPHFRAYLQAKDDRDGGDPQQFTFGPSVQFYLKPLVKLKNVTLFDLDDAKSRPLVVESGYRVITAPDTPVEDRAIEAVTFHFPLFARMLLFDRNRADLDWQSGSFTWRYRNRLTLERTFAVGSYHLIPYLAAEVFYESKYSKWSDTDLYVGSLFPVRRHVQSISITSTRMIRPRNPTGRTIMWASAFTCIFHSKKCRESGGRSLFSSPLLKAPLLKSGAGVEKVQFCGMRQNPGIGQCPENWDRRL